LVNSVRHILLVLIASVLALTVLPIADSQAKKRQEIRLYKVNKDGITQRLRFTSRKSKRPGCHNLLLRSRVFKVSHFGYEHCKVYRKKECDPDSIVEFQHDKVDETVFELSQGYLWQPVGEHKRGEKIKSWFCEAKDKPS